jgi:hypothetical protein
MTQNNEPHAVVRLLVKRMESHPEEFSNDNGRWAQWLDELMPFVTEKERLMLRKPMMQSIHEDVMDELLNGPERRREAEENRNEYERHLAQAMQHTQRQAMQGIVGAYSGGGGGGGGGGGASLPVSTSPYSSGGGSILPVANGGTGATTLGGTITGTKANSIMIDDQVLDGPMIKKIKRMLTRRIK